jgi:YidC/Oxa1 family membrane protein insertase
MGPGALPAPEERLNVDTEKRLLVAFALSALVFLLWFWLFPPPEPPAPAAQPSRATEEARETFPEAGTPSAPEAGAVSKPLGTGGNQDSSGETAADATGNLRSYRELLVQPQPEAVYENGLFKVRFSSKGGGLESVLLFQHKDAHGKPLELVYGGMLGRPGGAPLHIRIPSRPEREKEVNEALYAVKAEKSGSEAQTISLYYASESGLEVAKNFAFFPDSYLFSAEFKVTENGKPMDALVQMGPGFGGDEEAPASRFSHVREFVFGHPAGESRAAVERVSKEQVLKSISGGSPGHLKGWLHKRLPYETADKNLLKVLDNPAWTGLGDTYFTALALSKASFSHLFLLQEEKSAVEPAGGSGKNQPVRAAALLVPASELDSLAFLPKELSLLKSMGGGLADLVDLGVFWWLALPLKWLLDFFESFVGNYGLAIVLVTLLIKILFHPLTHKSMVSMRKMQRLQPKLNAIREKYKKKNNLEAKQAMNQEMMDLYKREGVNPMGGCLPMLLQLPVLFGFYNLLSVSIDLRQAPFYLWIRDLSLPDPWYVTPIVMGVTMYIQQRMSTPPSAGGNEIQMKMMRFMPLFFTWIFLNLPSGLVLYWLTNNVLTIGQQYWINRWMDGNGAPASSGKKSKRHKDAGGGEEKASS